MKDLVIDKQIGPDWWAEYTGISEEISARWVREQLAAFPDGETELRIVIDSPGGDVFEGITIFNLIRDFVRSHQDVRVTTYVQGMAASMASVIALAAWFTNPGRAQVQVEDNSAFMIHNAWDVACGNRHDLREAADFLEQVDTVLRGVYVRRTGRGNDEIGAMMDAETWLWGKEIADMGFADEVVDMEMFRANHAGDAAEGRDASLLSAKARFGAARQTMQKVSASAAKTERGGYRAAALALGFKDGSPSAKACGNHSAGVNKTGGCMAKITVEELKKDCPDVYAAACADGDAAGIQKERERVNRLLAMGRKSGCVDFALDCIRDNANPADDKIVDAFMDKGAAAHALAAQAAEENVPPLNTPKADKDAGAKAMMDAFDKGLKSGGYDDGND